VTSGRRSRSAKAPDGVELPPPTGLRAQTVVLDDDEYLVLALPIPGWDVPESLTKAERSIAVAVLRGDTNERIALDRRTSVHTVANQIASIFAKLGVTSRIELAHRLASKRDDVGHTKKNYP
jgi:DNA-binding NarL/FixJ family response regulator